MISLNHIEFVKSHGLGNDYLVIDSQKLSRNLTTEEIRALCDRHVGVGADGVLCLEDTEEADFGLKIFNPDGSEAEKSGNGLRIFAFFLKYHRYITGSEVAIATKGGIVRALIEGDPRGEKGFSAMVSVELGKASFEGIEPCDADSLVTQTLALEERQYRIIPVNIGNPHCVILRGELDQNEIKRYGPLIETHERFKGRTNVQFAKVLDPKNLEILIWERGAGYTLASGTSAAAAAAACRKLGLIERQVNVRMPGGILEIGIDKDFQMHLKGPVAQICKGTIPFEYLTDIAQSLPAL